MNKKPPTQNSSRKSDRGVLLGAWILALVFSGVYAAVLYYNPALRQSEFAMVVEETDEEGVVKRKVKVERPEPNEEQVREIARNQERKKRDELKREVKKLVEVVRETEEIKRQRKKELASRTVDDEAFRLAIEIEIAASQLRRAVLSDPIMSKHEPPKEGSARTLEIATLLADKARSDTDGVLTADEAAEQVTITEELVEISSILVEVIERGRRNLIEKTDDKRKQNQIRRELSDEIRLSDELLEKSEAYLAFIRDLLHARLDESEFPELPPLDFAQLAELGRKMLENLTDEQERLLEAALFEKDPEMDWEELPESELAEMAADTLDAGEQAALAAEALTETENLPFDPSTLSDEQLADLSEQAFDAHGEQAGLEEMTAQFSDEALNQMSANDLYETAQELSEQVNQNFTEARAAELAAAQSQSLEEALNNLYQPGMPETPDLSDLIGSDAPPPSNSEQFEAYNAALEQAVRAASNLAQTAESRASQLSGMNREEGAQMSGEQLSQMLRSQSSVRSAMASMASTQGQPQGAMADMTSLMAQAYQMSGNSSSNAFGDEGHMNSLLNRGSYEGSMGANTNTNGRVLENISTREIVAQALPGRKFTDESDRKGWLFIDTWYIIGPWERPRNAVTSFDDEKFPPETLIDFDAEYLGKPHPRTKDPLKLKWRFVQTDRIRINPPDEITDSTYYAYTEIHSDRPREVLLAVGTDDYAKVWINDLVVWEENGLSSWQLDQGFRKVLLRKGYNKILVRLESGPGVAFFSLVLCPVNLDT